MISMLAFDKDKKELQEMETVIRDAAGKLSDEQWTLWFLERLEAVREFINRAPLLDLLCFDITVLEGINYLEQIREDYKETMLLLVADMTISPMVYMNPRIMAASLLLRPFTKEQLTGVVYDLIAVHMKKQDEVDEDLFIVDTREGKTRIPYEQIYYFEAREKKIYLRTENREYGFYDTMEQLEGMLPECFVRCHRSFIVHKSKVNQVMFSKNVLLLQKEMMIPLSRSYKPAVKGWI